MALWRKTGSNNKMVQTDLAAQDLGLDIYLCTPGPSLAKIEDSLLHVNGALVAAVNYAYPHVRPDIWFGLDDPHCFDSTMWTQSFMKVLRGNYYNRAYHGEDIGQQYNCYYAPVKWFAEDESRRNLHGAEFTKEHEGIFYNKGLDTHFPFGETTRFANSVLLYMGAKRIFLLGCDLDNTKKAYHFDYEYEDPQRRTLSNTGYSQVLDFYRWASKIGMKYGVEYISCTEGSPVNEFLTYMPVDEALEMTIMNRALPHHEKTGATEREAEIRKARYFCTNCDTSEHVVDTCNK